jgi:hypothetical protein
VRVRCTVASVNAVDSLVHADESESEHGRASNMSRSRIARRIALSSGILVCAASAFPLASPAATVTQTGVPSVSTGGVSAHGSAVRLRGSINPRGEATTYYFQYGPTVAYGAQTPSASLPAGTVAVKVTQTATGLRSGYHYRLVATNASGTKEGRDHTYTAKTKTKIKKKKSKFELPKTFQPTPLGGVFILSGTLTGTGNANRAIVLQASPYPYSAPFANVGNPIATNAAGHFSFRVAKLSVNTKFRVATVGSPPLYSPVVPEQVAVRVTLKASSSKRTGLARLYGTVTPAQVGARVFLQFEKTTHTEKGATREKPTKLERPGKGESERSEERGEEPKFATKFSTVVKRATKTLARFSVVVSIRDAGHYRAFVEVRSGPLASGHSASILVSAATPKKHKHRAG